MIPQVPPPDPASDFGIERTARMNTTPFPGHGMREAQNRDLADLAGLGYSNPDDLMTDALAGDLANELPTQTLIAGKIGQLQRSIAEALFEKRKQQEIVVLANAKIRQLTVSMHADEVALDGLLIAEA